MKCCIWCFSICSMVAIGYKEITPTYREETLFTTEYIETAPIYPGSSISQSFVSTDDTLTSFEIALSYGEMVSDDCTVSIALYRGDTFIMEQPLQINVCPNQTFFAFYVNQKDCLGETFCIQITNTTESNTNSDSVEFALMSTDKEHSYLNNTQNYAFNDSIQNARLLCRFNYHTGYDYNKAITHIFWLFLGTLIFSEALLRFIHSRTATSQ